jgi:hypothetical protein
MRRALLVAPVIVLMLVAVLSALASPTHNKVIASCPGSERWDVKKLTDTGASGAGSVRYSPVVDTTVRELRKSNSSAPIGNFMPRRADERTVFRVTANLVEAETVLKSGSQKGDEDIHLVIAEPGRNLKMIAEFPKGGCIPESNSAKASSMDKARAAFVKACGTPPLGHFKTFPATAIATITGVGFFDKRHPTPQRGRALHDRELHPVLSFKAVRC